MDDLIRHYQDELTYLRNAGDFFAKNHPDIARHLRMDSPDNADPFVAKLVESFAFLTARVKQELDTGYAEINDALLDIVLPHLTKPIPSLATIAIVPQTGHHSIQHLPKNSEVTCVVEDQTFYKFKALYDTDIVPLKISDITFENAPFAQDAIKKMPDAKSRLTIELKTLTSEDKISQLPLNKLRFYINLESEYAYLLYELIFNRAMGTGVQFNHDKYLFTQPVPIKAVGFNSQEAALPYANNSFEGYRLITEFFAYPQKFLYFDIALDEEQMVFAHETLTLTVYFNEKNTRLDKVIDAKALQLNTLPLINLYDKKSESITLSSTQFEYSVIPAEGAHEGVQEIYKICEVQPVSKDDAIVLYPYFGLKHHAPQQKNCFYWHIRRRITCEKLELKNRNNNLQISFTSLDSQPQSWEKAMMKAALLCFNTDLYQKLYEEHQPFTFNLAQEDAKKYEKVNVLGALTDIQTIPLGNHEKWKIISHLGFHLNSIFDETESAEPLKEMLRIYEVAGEPYHQQLIDCFEKLAVKPTMSRIKMGKHYGFSTVLEIQLHLNDSYKKQAGIYLLGCVLRQFLSLYVAVNQIVHFKMLDKKQEVIYEWQPLIRS